MSNILSPQWLQHYYQFESIDDLQQKLVFTESAAEKHMLETEIKRRSLSHMTREPQAEEVEPYWHDDELQHKRKRRSVYDDINTPYSEGGENEYE